MHGILESRIAKSGLVVLGLTISLILLRPDNLADIYLKNYIVDSICLVVSISLLLNLYVWNKIDLFSPFSFFSLIYIVMFFVTPIYDILIGEILWFNIDLFAYGIKGSLYALLGYFVFYLAYKNKFTSKRNQLNYIKEYKGDEFSNETRRNLITFILIGYCVCLFANLFYLVRSGGNSILYILTLGALGGDSTANVMDDIGAISMLSYALPSFTLLYVEYGRSRFLKVLTFVLMFELQVARGFRFFILQIIVMFGAYYYIKTKKKPKIRQVLLIVAGAFVPIIIMTMFRTGIRAGDGMDLSIISQETITEALNAAFWENLRIYKNYYALIKVVPGATPHLYGKQMIIYTAIMFIPRAIWSGKPGNPGTLAQKIALGNAAIYSGSAYPGLGEYYYEFGLMGIVFWMGAFGLWLKKIEDRFRYGASSRIDQMIYCTILGIILQLIIRGYTPSNFWMLIFALIPYWIIKMFFIKRGKI